MSRLLLLTVLVLWTLNIAYVLLDMLHAAPVPHSTQPLMVLGALSATILWARLRGDQWQLGYHRGVLDTLRAQREQMEAERTAHNATAARARV